MVETIRLLLNPEDLPDVKPGQFSLVNILGDAKHHLLPVIVIFNFLSHQDDSKTDFVQVLEDNMRATESLVTKLAERNGDSGPRISQDDAFRQCQKVTSEVRTFRTHLLHYIVFHA